VVVNFNTSNLSERVYTRMIRNILLHLGADYEVFMAVWNIRIHDLKDTNTDFFKHFKTTSGQKINSAMPSGATGKYVMDLWLHDSKNEFMMRENSDRIQHEICHAVLFGKQHWVKAVHERQDNYRFFRNFWYWRFPMWRRMRLSIIDVRDLVN